MSDVPRPRITYQIVAAEKDRLGRERLAIRRTTPAGRDVKKRSFYYTLREATQAVAGHARADRAAATRLGINVETVVLP